MKELLAQLQSEEGLVRLIAYDTWGNTEDGFQVNDSHDLTGWIKPFPNLLEDYFGVEHGLKLDDSEFEPWELVRASDNKPVGRVEFNYSETSC